MPLKCFAMLLKMVLPTPGFSEAPITAMEDGEKKMELDTRCQRIILVLNLTVIDKL